MASDAGPFAATEVPPTENGPARAVCGDPVGPLFGVLYVALLFVLPLAAPVRAQVFVDADATGANDGSSWVDAYTSLQTALTNSTGDDEIWVAEGVYTPDSETESFTIPGGKDGLRLFGGFDGTESVRSERAPGANPAVLSGDVDGNDNTNSDGVTLSSVDISGSNAHHVPLMDGTTGGTISTSTVVNGVIVTGGQASGSGADLDGGGLYCDGSGNGNACSPTLQNVVFAGNFAEESGGAIYNEGSGEGTASPTLVNVVFAGNFADAAGGALYNNANDGTASPSITNATLSGNGALGSGGAVYNNAPNGGTASLQVTNTILWGNDADVNNNGTGTGNEIFNTGAGATPTASHSILEGGLEDVSENDGSATVDGGNNLDQSPRFLGVANPDGQDGTFATRDDGLNLGIGSPALDAGANGSLDISIDITGAPRIVDRNGDGIASANIGAYEITPPPGITPMPAPDQLTGADVGADIQLRWTAVNAHDLREYRVYRDTASIEGRPSEIAALDTVAAPDTSYLDTSAEQRETYYCRVTAVDSSENESDFSPEARVFLYPPTVTAEVNRPFGSEGRSSEYRLVALPGQVNRPLADAILGEAGIEWQAYWDNGEDDNFLVSFDGSSTFTFQPGNGFWLTATRTWTSNATFPTVTLQGDSVATIPVRDGWNVISNPLDRDVSWTQVDRENPGSLQILFGFPGTFSSTNNFRSAKAGVAYYFFNDDTTRTTLEIPYPDAPDRENTRTNLPSASVSGESSLLALTASRVSPEEAMGSTVRIGIEEDAARGLRPEEDFVAPPGRFEGVSLRIEASTPPSSAWPRSERARSLMTERRPPAEDGQPVALRLTNQTEGPVALRAENLSAVEGREVVLLHPAAGTSYDLRSETPVTVEPEDDVTQLTLAIGSSRFVEDKRSEVVPDAVRLSSRPNPMRRQGTIEYALPEAQDVRLVLYDVLGRQLAVLADGRTEAGRHDVRLDADRLSSGVYFARLTTGAQTLTRKITVTR